MAAISNNNIARAIYQASRGTREDGQALFSKNVVRFLNRKKLLSKSDDILRSLNKIINNEEGKLEISIRSAQKLNDTERKGLRAVLSKRYPDKELILREQVDESVLGGWRIEVDDEVIDLSIKERMKKLQEHLTKQI